MQIVWQTADGLPQNSVQAIVQTRDGYLWIGTQDGLARFDGVRFTVFNKENTEEIKHNNIRALCLGGDDTLWIGTDGGLARFRNEDGFSVYTTADGLSNDIVASICEARDGGLWVGTWGGGLNRLREGRFEIYAGAENLSNDYVAAICEGGAAGDLWIGTYGGGLVRLRDGKFTAYTTEDGLSHNRLRAIHEDARGRLWIGTRGGGLNCLEDGAWKIYTTREGLAGDSVWAIYEDREGSLWIGTYGNGLSRFREGEFTSFTVDEGLSDNFVWSFCEDREGGLWIGTGGGGVNRLQEGKLTAYTTRDGLAKDIAWSLYEDGEENLWIGTYGGGLSRFRDGTFTNYTTRDGLANDFVEAIYGDDEGGLWVGTDGGGLSRYRNEEWTTYTTDDGLAHNAVSAIYKDAKNRLWIGTKGGGLNCLKDGKFDLYTAKNGLSNDFVRAICEDGEGCLWVGTRGGGLSRYANGEWTTLTTKDGLSSNVIFSIYADREANLWVCTGGGGLNRYRGGRWTAYTTKDGFFHDSPFKALEDDCGALWLSCTKGIFSVSKNHLDEFDEGRVASINCTAYDAADGMKSSECNGGFQSAGWKTGDGKLWFPTIKGVVRVDPDRITINELPPPVHIEQAIINKQIIAVTTGEKIQIAPGKGELEFHYAALSFIAPERVRFKYLLEGFDREWTDAGARRVAYYTNIPPGEYRFRVKACNSDGVWNERGAAFDFYLQPHFYQTRSFYSLCAIGAGGIGAIAYRRHVRKLKEREEELTRLVGRRTRELAKANRMLQSLSTEDALTGIFNRRYFDDALDTEWRRAERSRSLLSLIMIDIDYFKEFNDAYGHQRGDECLKQVAGVLRAVVNRAGDVVARYGGEEFAAILQGNTHEGARTVAEVLRSRVEALRIAHEKSGVSRVVTISAGVATMLPEEYDGQGALIALADKALYKAKGEGRNRVEACDLMSEHILSRRDI